MGEGGQQLQQTQEYSPRSCYCAANQESIYSAQASWHCAILYAAKDRTSPRTNQLWLLYKLLYTSWLTTLSECLRLLCIFIWCATTS